MPEENKPKSDISGALNKLKDTLLNFLLPLIAIIGAVLLGALYIVPSYKSLPVKKDELQRKVTLRNTLSQKVTDLNRLVDYKSAFDENLEVVNKVLVPEAEVPRLLDQASQMTEKAGMELDRLSYSYGSMGETGGDFDTVTVSMGTKSSLEQLILFMELVEKASRFVSVPSFRYSVSDRTADAGGAVSSTFSVDSPYLFVQSSAVTDDPIRIDVTSPDFISFMNMIKGLDYYDFINRDIKAEEEKPKEEEEATEVPAAPEDGAPVQQPETVSDTVPSSTAPVETPEAVPSTTKPTSIFPTQ